MEITTKYITFQTQGHTQLVNLTDEIQELLAESGLQEGHVLVAGIGSTGGVSTVEYEPGLVNHDISEALDKIAPYGKDYAHNKTWGDDNGASHIRSTLTGTSLTVPFENGRLILGTWQQIIFIDFDTSARSRKVVAQFTGVK